ncbi:winged helix-turn-helix domain-containing protein, partial [Candidatus Woesearchaeota archaeon]|nr:winged helix-turn-helix domain-containing protein [Candidatus Woesearchaeota archaeon]
NEKKVLDKISECVKIDIPALAEKTGLSKPTVRTIVNKFISSNVVILNASAVPAKIGCDIMTIYEISYPSELHGEKLTNHLQETLFASNNSAIVFKINPSQSIVIAFYQNLDHKDFSFSNMLQCIQQKEGGKFQPIIKELWTRPSKDFFYDPSISKFLKGIENFKKSNK